MPSPPSRLLAARQLSSNICPNNSSCNNWHKLLPALLPAALQCVDQAERGASANMFYAKCLQHAGVARGKGERGGGLGLLIRLKHFKLIAPGNRSSKMHLIKTWQGRQRGKRGKAKRGRRYGKGLQGGSGSGRGRGREGAYDSTHNWIAMQCSAFLEKQLT